MPPRISRRRFLQGSAFCGATAAMFPWLRSDAQTGRSPKLVLFFTPHGTIFDKWRPGGSGENYTLSPILSPLAAHRSKVSVIDGLSMAAPYQKRVPHTYDMTSLWTGSPIETNSTEFRRNDHQVSYGWNRGVSIDQMIAERLAPTTPFRTLELGVNCGNAHPHSRMIYTGPGRPRNPLDNPGRAFEQVFSDFENMPPMMNAEPDPLVLQRRSVLDAVLADLGSVKGSLSAADRNRLDAHATAIREIEQSLQDTEMPPPVVNGCTVPAAPDGGGRDKTIDQQMSILAASLACGRTQIASMQVAAADNDGALYNWVGINSGGHHLTSHDRGDAAQNKLADLYTWYAQRFAALLDAMERTPDGDGMSLLDNSIVIWGTELGQGWNHSLDNIPFVVAGGGAGKLRGGQYLTPTGRHNRLLVSACQAMGLADVTSYGETDEGQGGVPGLLA